MQTFASSRVLRETREGRLATCFKLNIPSPHIVELAGLAGVSTIWLCQEHVPNDWSMIEHQIRAARIYGMDVIVRVAKGSYSDYLRPFEAGANGIMVPHVTSAKEAEQIVQMTRPVPVGRRALDSGNVDGKFCQIPLADYLNGLQHEQFVIIQIESPEAVAAVDEIAAVKGFDFLLFGPGDYAHLIGRAGDINHPEVLAARKKVEEAALRHGKRCMSVGYRDKPEVMLERGYSIVYLQADVLALRTGFESALAEFAPAAAAATGGTSPYSR